MLARYLDELLSGHEQSTVLEESSKRVNELFHSDGSRIMSSEYFITFSDNFCCSVVGFLIFYETFLSQFAIKSFESATLPVPFMSLFVDQRPLDRLNFPLCRYNSGSCQYGSVSFAQRRVQCGD